MARIQRANVLLDVKDDEVGYYLNLGYNLLDEHGNVVKESVPTDIHTLQKHFVDSKKQIADLQDEIAKLKVELAKAKSAKNDAPKKEKAAKGTDK